MAKLKDVVTGDYIKCYQICGDEEWHEVFEIHPESNGDYYIGIKGVNGKQRRGDIEVEIMYR